MHFSSTSPSSPMEPSTPSAPPCTSPSSSISPTIVAAGDISLIPSHGYTTSPPSITSCGVQLGESQY
ncbi:hypothetical protein AQUCO_02500319v1 [Aquilegia coerulea]|uniref:Uncharacterized protein n=1 Tax=Aquilegia coerulea TaxID=218851 RepID=A0A2G5DAH6_AQUCA|nr:hypothetical protein AQUCO_02500319v1 [Aquilegia coerulea]